jgi:hypothetical protein
MNRYCPYHGLEPAVYLPIIRKWFTKVPAICTDWEVKSLSWNECGRILHYFQSLNKLYFKAACHDRIMVFLLSCLVQSRTGYFGGQRWKSTTFATRQQLNTWYHISTVRGLCRMFLTTCRISELYPWPSRWRGPVLRISLIPVCGNSMYNFL